MDTCTTTDTRLAFYDTSDQELIAALHSGQAGACHEFVTRHRRLLEAYARKARIPTWEWDSCITEVLADEVMRFSRRSLEPPANLPAYLIKAVYNRYLRIRRSLTCRERYHSAAASDTTGEWIVPSLCSESALRSSAGPDAQSLDASPTLDRLAADLGRQLTEQERVILGWVGQGISHREIAEWLEVSYEAATKRIWRLCRRLRMEAAKQAEQYAPRERSEIERFIRRAS